MNDCRRTWKPVWLTTNDFSDSKPKCMYHREQEPDKEPVGPGNRHILVRGEFVLPEGNKANSLVLRITADDYYKVYVDGTFAGQGPAPGVPEKYYYNECTIIPELLLPGSKHVLAVHLYYQGTINRVWNSADGRCAMAAGLFMDETEMKISWKYQNCDAFSGDTIGYETQFLENFDAGKWEDDWMLPSYDDGRWNALTEAEWADYVLASEPVPMLSVYDVEPECILESPSKDRIYDFGKEVTAGLVIDAEAGVDGAQIRIRCGEELNPDGSVRFDMRCMCRYEEMITCRKGVNHVEQYDYKGFRYVEVRVDKEIHLCSLKARVRHYPMDSSACEFRTEHENLQKIFDICRRGVMLGTQEGYLDCPTREKGQYLGDAIITSRSQVWLTGKTDMLKKCVEQFALSSVIDDGLMGVAPGSFMQEIADFSLLFSQMLLTCYEFTGDKEWLAEYEPVAAQIIEHFRRYEREDGLLEQVADKWNLVDWPQNLRDGYDFELSRPIVAPGCHNVINALYIGAVKTDNQLCDILGWPRRYQSEKLEQAFVKAFFHPETGLFCDSEKSSHSAVHSNLYPLYFEMVPEEYKDRVCDFIVEKGLCCGVMISYFLLKGLAKAGRRKDMFDLLVNESEHGWVQMLRDGATTCFEAWGKEQKWNTSLCHPWASAPISLIIEEIAGIHPDPSCENGYRMESQIPEICGEFYLKVRLRGQEIVCAAPF